MGVHPVLQGGRMRTLREIEELLPELASSCADELEDQDLDFKQWDLSSMRRRCAPLSSGRSAWPTAAVELWSSASPTM